ncbi:uncharacterized protein LOC106478811 isoform X2 [Limulus polyphemus]|nr:uncharacterized protein LOC106478811 isoform X2 [Limulus polyphemus]XP_022238194.1 uncharacterized protein LOC106478811 isoform X2 [Limulus polyphemus]
MVKTRRGSKTNDSPVEKLKPEGVSNIPEYVDSYENSECDFDAADMNNLQLEKNRKEKEFLEDKTDSNKDKLNSQLITECNQQTENIVCSDEDSAPDEVTFSSGKEAALTSAKEASRSAKQVINKTKQKRRDAHSRNIAQKEQKRQRIEALEHKRFPCDLVENLDNLPAKLGVTVPQNKLHIVGKPKKKKFEEDDELNPVEETKQSEDFISLHGSTEFQVKILPKELKRPKPIAENALDFRQNMLYGKKNKRESVQSFMGKKEKQVVGGKC